MQHERRVAIFDMLEENYFRPLDSESGPYVVRLSLRDTSKLLFDISRPIGEAQATISLSLIPFRRIIKVHNEGSRLLTDSLRHQAEIEFQTSRRLFTLICSLHRRPK